MLSTSENNRTISPLLYLILCKQLQLPTPSWFAWDSVGPCGPSRLQREKSYWSTSVKQHRQHLQHEIPLQNTPQPGGNELDPFELSELLLSTLWSVALLAPIVHTVVIKLISLTKTSPDYARWRYPWLEHGFVVSLLLLSAVAPRPPASPWCRTATPPPRVITSLSSRFSCSTW